MVGIYCRISGKKEEGKDVSISVQKEQGIAFANKLGMEYIIYEDIGISGTTGIEIRQGFASLIKDINSKKVTHIYAYNQSRIERGMNVWEYFVGTVINANAKWYPSGTYFDLRTPTNEAMASIMSVFNKLHVQNTRVAVTQALTKNALNGKGVGIKAYGIDYDEQSYMIHNDEEIEVVKLMFKWSLQGMGTLTIARKLNDLEIPTRHTILAKQKGIKSKFSGRWNNTTVHGILNNKLYAGIHTYGKQIIELPHLAIMSKSEFNEVQKNLEKNKNNVGKNSNFPYLLNDLMVCGHCGQKISGAAKIQSRSYPYKCLGTQWYHVHRCTNSKNINIHKLDTFILFHLFKSKNLQNILNSIEISNNELTNQQLRVKRLDKDIKSVESKLANIRNNMNEYPNDTGFVSDYKKSSKVLDNLNNEYKRENEKLALLTKNNRSKKTNEVIKGYDISKGFEAVKTSVNSIIENILIHHINGYHSFIIKYKGYEERTLWITKSGSINHVGRLTFNLIGIENPKNRITDKSILEKAFNGWGNISKEQQQIFIDALELFKENKPPNEGFDRYISGNLEMIELNINELKRFF